MSQYSPSVITTLLAEPFNRQQDEPFKRSLLPRMDFWRSTLISRSLEKHPEQSKFFRQTIWVPIVCSPAIPCKIPVTLCRVGESQKVIPSAMRYNGSLYDYLGAIDGSEGYRFCDPGTEHLILSNKFMKTPVYSMVNGKPRVFNPNGDISKFPPMIRIDGVFDRPEDVFNYNCQEAGRDCDYWEQPYPATGDIIQMIIQYILTVDFNLNQKEAELPTQSDTDPKPSIA